MPSARYNALGAALLVALAACDGDPTLATVVVRVEVAPDRDTLSVGEIKAPFVATAFNARGDAVPGAQVTWTSDQPFIVAVDSFTGTLSAVGLGAAAVTARAGAVSDTAQVFVVGPLTLPLDTILLFPGDTLTIPTQLRAGASGSVTFGGGAAGIATISAAGLVTALDFGLAPFTATVDTFTVRGEVQVLNVPDTTLGNVYASLSGARNVRFRMASRAFSHPTLDGRTATQFVAESFDGLDRLVLELIDSVAGPRTQTLGELPVSATQTGADPVCFPPVSWMFYNDFNNVRRGRSLSGTVALTALRPVPGGTAVSGRFTATVQMLDTPGAAGQVTVRGTMLVPIVTLASCPQGTAPPPSLERRTPLAPPDGTPRPRRR